MNRTIPKKVAVTVTMALALVVGVVGPAAAVPPDNDDIADAIEAAALPFTDSVDTTEATREPGEPACVGSGHTVWYRVTPASNMRLLAHTFGSDYDTTLAVYSGSPGSLQQVACNDDSYDSQGYWQSRVSFNAVASTTYYVMAGSYGGYRGGSLSVTIREAPEIEFYVDSVGWLNVVSGGPTATGTVTCTQPADVDVQLHFVQRQGDRTVHGWAATEVADCDDSPTAWKASVPSGTFRFGEAVVNGAASGDGQRTETSETAILRSCTRIGTLGDDRMEGSRRNDKLCGLAGNDVLEGGGGNDMFFGFDGADVVRGGDGNDAVYGGSGRDELSGNAGDDLVNGADGNDSLSGGPGVDRCVGGKGNNRKTGCERS